MHARQQEVTQFQETITEWAASQEDVRAVAMVGSWARGKPHQDSDLDIVLLTNSASKYIEMEHWARDLGAESVIATRSWGAATERRLQMPTGLEVEVGVTTPAWASIEPLDPGTAAVAAAGFIALYDPDRILRRLIAVIRTR